MNYPCPTKSTQTTNALLYSLVNLQQFLRVQGGSGVGSGGLNYKVNIKFASVKSEGYYNSTFQVILNVLNVQTESSQF